MIRIFKGQGIIKPVAPPTKSRNKTGIPDIVWCVYRSLWLSPGKAVEDFFQECKNRPGFSYQRYQEVTVLTRYTETKDRTRCVSLVNNSLFAELFLYDDDYTTYSVSLDGQNGPRLTKCEKQYESLGHLIAELHRFNESAFDDDTPND